MLLRQLQLLLAIGFLSMPSMAKGTSKPTLLGQLSPFKRASLLNYPDFPKETYERIHGKRNIESISPFIQALSRDWGLAHIGFFKVFNPLLKPIRPSISVCSPLVVVAVVDTGIDYTHPDLRDSVWINPGERGPWNPLAGMESYTHCRDKSCNGIDDDGNGLTDDVAGWDFVHDVPLPYDTHGHGSHISGIIASHGVANKSGPGVCPGVSIMALKYYDASGVGYNNLQNTVRAFQYAVRMGAKIINYSGGGTDPAPAERMAIENARNYGVLVVAAAGNEGQNNDVVPYFPASYGIDNIISVASINSDDQLLESSNWGPKKVDVAAPGHAVVSSLPSSQYGIMTGTSQATAFVTGTAALLASQLPSMQEFDYKKIKRWITEGTKPLPANRKKQVIQSGVLSVNGALDKELSEMNQVTLRKQPAVIALKPSAQGGMIIPNSRPQ